MDAKSYSNYRLINAASRKAAYFSDILFCQFVLGMSFALRICASLSRILIVFPIASVSQMLRIATRRIVARMQNVAQRPSSVCNEECVSVCGDCFPASVSHNPAIAFSVLASDPPPAAIGPSRAVEVLFKDNFYRHWLKPICLGVSGALTTAKAPFAFGNYAWRDEKLDAAKLACSFNHS